MKFAMLMLFGTVLTRIVYHLRNRTREVSLQAEALDFVVTFVIYTALFLLIVGLLELRK